MREDRIRKAAKDGRTLYNAWLTLNNPFLIELIGEAGWDCLTIDQQHGLGGNEALVGCLTAARASGLPAIVRVAENSPGLIGRALDAGAQGIMCPLIGSVEDADAFVQAVKYPPHGNRSW
ncbi:MAG TPA: aldolase/citrate lyase family protein, partial [Methyloceanibacter sp.]|nr:aldolase/citrate lyase family protein [Methyloceanibacter sp.]